MTDVRISKVEILLRQGKLDEAEQLLKELLSGDTNNILFLSLLAEVHLQQDKVDSARNIVGNAIALSPDSSHLFYIKSRIAIQQGSYDEAEQSIQHALELDPYDATYFAMFANIKLLRKQYEEALTLANKALEIDAENLLGLNTRSTALLKLNRSAESFATIEGALREEPNNAYTHANYGWGLLEKGEHKKALEHFRESLKNDPTFEYAQLGMMEALKASNAVYRLFLQYKFWMGNLRAKHQWGVIIGFVIGVRILRGIAKASETLQPYLIPFVILLSLVAFSTWILTPIGNLFLRFNPYGNFLLGKHEKMSANFVAVSFLIFFVGLLMFFVLADDRFLPVAAFGFAMMPPFSVMFSPSTPKHALFFYSVIMAAAGIASIGLTFSTGDVFNSMTFIFILGFVVFQWVANFLLIEEDNR